VGVGTGIKKQMEKSVSGENQDLRRDPPPGGYCGKRQKSREQLEGEQSHRKGGTRSRKGTGKLRQYLRSANCRQDESERGGPRTPGEGCAPRVLEWGECVHWVGKGLGNMQRMVFERGESKVRKAQTIEDGHFTKLNGGTSKGTGGDRLGSHTR